MFHWHQKKKGPAVGDEWMRNRCWAFAFLWMAHEYDVHFYEVVGYDIWGNDLFPNLTKTLQVKCIHFVVIEFVILVRTSVTGRNIFRVVTFLVSQFKYVLSKLSSGISNITLRNSLLRLTFYFANSILFIHLSLFINNTPSTLLWNFYEFFFVKVILTESTEICWFLLFKSSKLFAICWNFIFNLM